VPETRAPAKFMLRYGYSLWYDVIFVDNISVLLAAWTYLRFSFAQPTTSTENDIRLNGDNGMLRSFKLP